MSSYEILKSVHLIAVAVWLGGGLFLYILISRAFRSGDRSRVAMLTDEAEAVGTKVFMPASIVVLLAGIGLVFEGDWGWDLWIILGTAAIVASALTGALYLGKESARLGMLIAERGLEDAEVQTRGRRLALVNRIELAILFLVVIDMVAKPGA